MSSSGGGFGGFGNEGGFGGANRSNTGSFGGMAAAAVTTFRAHLMGCEIRARCRGSGRMWSTSVAVVRSTIPIWHDHPARLGMWKA